MAFIHLYTKLQRIQPRDQEERGGNKVRAHQHLQGQPSHATHMVGAIFRTLDFPFTEGALISGAHELYSRLGQQCQ